MARKRIDLPKEQFTTPTGRAVWPHLHAPDTSFNKDPEYNTQLNLDASEALPLVEMIDRVQEEAMEKVKDETGKAKRGPYAPYEEEDDGTYTFKFKMKAEGRHGPRRPKIFDAEGKKVPAGLRIGGGSQMKVAATAAAYNAPFGIGVTCYLNAVQLLKLETWGADNADAFGFDTEGGGFSADDVDESVFNSPDEFDEDEDSEADPDLDAEF